MPFYTHTMDRSPERELTYVISKSENPTVLSIDYLISTGLFQKSYSLPDNFGTSYQVDLLEGILSEYQRHNLTVIEAEYLRDLCATEMAKSGFLDPDDFRYTIKAYVKSSLLSDYEGELLIDLYISNYRPTKNLPATIASTDTDEDVFVPRKLAKTHIALALAAAGALALGAFGIWVNPNSKPEAPESRTPLLAAKTPAPPAPPATEEKPKASPRSPEKEKRSPRSKAANKESVSPEKATIALLTSPDGKKVFNLALTKLRLQKTGWEITKTDFVDSGVILLLERGAKKATIIIPKDSESEEAEIHPLN